MLLSSDNYYFVFSMKNKSALSSITNQCKIHSYIVFVSDAKKENCKQYRISNDRAKEIANSASLWWGMLQSPHNTTILTHYMLNFSEGTKIQTFTFYVIPPLWHDTGSWNPASSKSRTYVFYTVNIMGADVLAMQGARASATMMLTMLNKIN